MANIEIPNDEVWTIPVLTTNSAGVVEPAPAGDTYTAAVAHDDSSDASASLAVAVVDMTLNGNAAKGVQLTPMVQESPNLTLTITDSAGLTASVNVFDIVQDVTPKNILLDVADVQKASQPVPTNAGP